MDHPANDLLKNPFLITLAGILSNFPQVGRMCLVGGAVRDALIGRLPVDFDFTSEGDPTPLARTFAARCGGYWFWLDEQRRQSRVGIGEGTFDFSPWREPTLAGDLAARDFTINAMAIDIAESSKRPALIDPLGGRDDLSGKILRCAGPSVLQNDPLRVLKGIRHTVELNLEIEPATLLAMQSTAAKLTVSAPERLRVEIWRILAAPSACRGFDWLVECGAAETLFGKDFCSSIAVVQRAVLCANALFSSLTDVSPIIAEWLCEPVEQGLDRGTLLRWSRTLGVINAELPLVVAHRWRFSRTSLSRIAALRTISLQLWQELLNLPQRPRAIALWALQYGPDPVDLLLSLGTLPDAEPNSIRAYLTPVLEMIAELPDVKKLPPLVDGNWLREELGIEGVELGAALAKLRQAELCGAISTADEARRYIVSHIPKKC